MATNNIIRLESIDVLPVKAESVDINNMDYIRGDESTEFPNVVFLVRFNFDGELPTDALGIYLYLDDYQIRKYSQCKYGVYFKVFNPRFLTKHSGKRICYAISGLKKQSTEVTFPDFASFSAVNSLIDLYPELPLAEKLLN